MWTAVRSELVGEFGQERRVKIHLSKSVSLYMPCVLSGQSKNALTEGWRENIPYLVLLRNQEAALRDASILRWPRLHISHRLSGVCMDPRYCSAINGLRLWEQIAWCGSK